MRDWLHVDDHVDGLILAAQRGRPGGQYNFGGGAERKNIDVARTICDILDRVNPRTDRRPHSEAITLVADRPGHDFRYAVDASKAQRDLGWSPTHDFEGGIAETIDWFLSNPVWLERPDTELGRRGLEHRT